MPRGDGRIGRPSTTPVKRPAYEPGLDDLLRQHPGLAESFIPVWGSAREAIADAYDGDVYGAVGNALLAGADLLPVGLAGKAMKAAKVSREIVQTSKKMDKTRAYEWAKVRKRLGNQRVGYLEKYQHGHHAIIPHKEGLGRYVSDRIKNHPLNIRGMPDREVHARIHGRYKDKQPYGQVERHLRGGPAWALAAEGLAMTHGGGAVAREVEERRKRR